MNLANVLNRATTITFDSNAFATAQTITLTSGQLELGDQGGTQTITGPAAGLTVNGNSKTRVFQVDPGVTASISGLTITGGGGTADRGGGLLNLARANLTLTNCTVSGNTAKYYNNQAYQGNGGGLANYGTATLTDCTVSGNTANANGGGLANDGMATVKYCTFSGNNAAMAGNFYGGAILTKGGELDLSDCTIASNTASLGGGGIDAQGPVTITSSTFSLNRAAFGGAIDNNHGKFTVKVQDSILAGDAAPNGPEFANNVTSLGNNLVSETDGSSGWVGSDLTGTIAKPLDPKLAPLGYYGGPTQTMALRTGSPAIGKGSVQSGFDQRGLPRPQGTPSDVGAFQSGPLVVNTTTDYNTSSPWGVLSLRQAVSVANVLESAATITFAPSVFDQTITLTGGQLELKDTGGTQTITGPAAGVTVSGGGLNRVFQVDTGVTASISGLKISNGNAAGNGGGLENYGVANLINCAFTGNMATVSGGGLANLGAMTLQGCKVSGNTASSGNGGGLWSYNSSGGGTATLTNCTVSGNMSAGAPGSGGGLFLKGPAINLTGCTISNNIATQTAGGLWSYVTGGGIATVKSCIVSGNTAGTKGGGVDNYTGKAYLSYCTVSANTAKAGSGGGLLNNNGNATTTLTDSTVSGNSASQSGGGVENPVGKVYLTNCTISGNTAGSGGGGGLYNNGTASLTSCTVSANSGGKLGGGGIYNLGGIATLTDTIVAGNHNASRTGFSDIEGGQPVTGTYNLIGPEYGNIPTGPGTGNIVSVTDPDLATLAFYGGPTQTMALVPGSPAIGKGVMIPGVTTDQRGFPLDTPKPDIGAFQFQSSPLVVNTIFDGSGVPPGKLDLRGAVDLAGVLPGSNTITFDPTVFATAQTITLTSGQLELRNSMSPGEMIAITGPEASVTVSGGGQNRVFQVDTGVTATISGLTITGGGGTADRGGGLLNLGTVTLMNCTVSGNTASQNGGGLANYGTATLTSCTVSGNNTATMGNHYGGGIFTKGRQLYLTNCTITSNAASLSGGGIEAQGPVTVTSSTFSLNRAVNGGAIDNYQAKFAVKVHDSILAADSAANGPEFDNSVTSLGNNLVSETDGGSGWVGSDLTGTIAMPRDARLAPLGNYGGPTQTMALLPAMGTAPASPAIGKGVPVMGVTTDERGLPRGSLVDIGAFQTSLLVESTAGPVNTAPAQLTLAGAVSLGDAFAGPIAINFDPAVFAGGETITLTAGQLELMDTGTIPNWTITGPAAGVTVSGGGLSRVFQIDPYVTASLSGLTVTGGGGTADGGGGLRNLTKANLTLTDCTLSGNTASQNGGGLLNVAGANLTLTDCTVSGNTASQSGGGLLNVAGANLTLTHCAVGGNTAGQNGSGLANYGAATLTDCTVSGNTAGSAGAGVFSSGGTLMVTNSTITGSTTGIQVMSDGSATISGGAVSGDGTGILVGASPLDACTVTVLKVDLSGDNTGVMNIGRFPVASTFNWWGSSSGPSGTGASKAVGLVSFDPWLGDTASLTLPTPDALGFGASSRYEVTPNTAVPNLSISVSGSPKSSWTVTPTGTVLFVGSGGSVTINGEPGTDAFTITNAAVTFAANDAFKGAMVQFNGSKMIRQIDAKGAANAFDVSGLTGALTMTAPAGTGTVQASKNAGYTLTNTSLTSTDGMSLMLSGFTTADLTTLAGGVNVIVDASAFTGVANLTAAGPGSAILYGSMDGGTLNVSATGSGNDILIGGTGANTLTDNSPATASGTGKDILIGGGGGTSGNTIAGNGDDILISGMTSYDANTPANIVALDAILAEWTSADYYATRVLKINTGITIPGGLAVLNGNTAKWNGKVNTVENGSEPTPQNWLLVNAANDRYTTAGQAHINIT